MINERIAGLIADFKRFSDWEERYKHLIEIGKKMSPMDESNRIPANLVKGCQSQVWLHADLVDGKIFFQADSDASIVKGIVALLVSVYSGSTPDEILMTKPTFLEDIGLREHLSMSRANGLNSMMKQISFFAMAYKAKMQMQK
ncbi:Fe-S metabolism protein SufE [Bacteriovorax stolpii]|uniref:Fe-S metabolism protein SufE n=1 Tax=Bacteriovorax stolpii TaxID=960 RepID=A0A2K9NRW3_BACTC|nr:SufE family protein [Bacteriovorax stolpii]AUN98260.1 Fe-S metabolism protein SufE [Bacteriovorax stolpii]TDP52183.1 cysteine desulfuration protein SufE [Bacteriovorax stolpii]